MKKKNRIQIDISSYYEQVVFIARKIYNKVKNHPDNRATINDLISEGMKELCKCKNRYDPDRGVKFWSYARYRVENGMKDYLEGFGLTKNSRVKRYKREKKRLEKKMGREPADMEMAEALNIDVKKIIEIKEMSVWLSVRKNIEQMQLADGNKNPEEDTLAAVESLELKDDLKHCTKGLTQRRKRLIKARFGEEKVTLKMLAKSEKISIPAIWQDVKKGLGILKTCLEKRGWKTIDFPQAAEDGNWSVEEMFD